MTDQTDRPTDTGLPPPPEYLSVHVTDEHTNWDKIKTVILDYEWWYISYAEHGTNGSNPHFHVLLPGPGSARESGSEREKQRERKRERESQRERARARARLAHVHTHTHTHTHTNTHKRTQNTQTHSGGGRYAILAVELFGYRSPDFRNFHESIFSMWQVLGRPCCVVCSCSHVYCVVRSISLSRVVMTRCHD